MNITIGTFNSISYIHCLPGWLISSEQVALDLLGACAENTTERILVSPVNLPDSFYDLRSGLAGAVLGRFSIYRIRVAFCIPSQRIKDGRFGEMVLEANRGNEYHFSDHCDLLIHWLCQE